MNEHPRLKGLRDQLYSLPIDPHYRVPLLQSIRKCGDQFVARPPQAPDEGWDDLETLQAMLGK